ncbi:hypothetical protein [Stieleria sedimenti]|uniref:hypothetical protein n=1 Tax=Stieleria sedimenti TaxID=2976331 RepID=UPI00217F8D4E|nr:hypothetical protein [Stieleria sedimenti]
MALLLGVIGCVGEPGSPKTSHFEHDHEVAKHWPSDLADASAKLRARLDAIEAAVDENPDEAQQLADEVAEIVSWVPEIAADTNLSEQDWIPLDHAAESLAAKLRAAGSALTESNRRQTFALCEQIDQALSKIPDPFASRKGASR